MDCENCHHRKLTDDWLWMTMIFSRVNTLILVIVWPGRTVCPVNAKYYYKKWRDNFSWLTPTNIISWNWLLNIIRLNFIIDRVWLFNIRNFYWYCLALGVSPLSSVSLPLWSLNLFLIKEVLLISCVFMTVSSIQRLRRIQFWECCNLIRLDVEADSSSSWFVVFLVQRYESAALNVLQWQDLLDLRTSKGPSTFKDSWDQSMMNKWINVNK